MNIPTELSVFDPEISMMDIMKNHVDGVTSYLITKEDDEKLYKQWLEYHQWVSENEKHYDYFFRFQKYYKIFVKGRLKNQYRDFFV